MKNLNFTNSCTINMNWNIYTIFIQLKTTFFEKSEFFLRLGCKKITPNLSTFPVYLQYSNNGGISWTTIEQFDFNKYSSKPTYIALHLPENARTNSTRIRWWQPSADGTFLEDWAIDHVC
jgi:reelin